MVGYPYLHFPLSQSPKKGREWAQKFSCSNPKKTVYGLPRQVHFCPQPADSIHIPFCVIMKWWTRERKRSRPVPFGFVQTICRESSSHTLPEGRGARSPDAGQRYIRQRRNSRLLTYFVTSWTPHFVEQNCLRPVPYLFTYSPYSFYQSLP